jgi:outer membrane lipoprotein-sorting protein
MEMSFPKDAPFPSEVRVREETGDSTVIRFHDVRLNEPLKDALFTFSPPKGVELKERDAD